MFLIKTHFYMTKKARQKFKFLETKVKQKVFFIIFKGLSVTENCLRLESMHVRV